MGMGKGKGGEREMVVVRGDRWIEADRIPEGLWKLDIKIPETYPLAPPAVRFVTPVCHPNVNFKVPTHPPPLSLLSFPFPSFSASPSSLYPHTPQPHTHPPQTGEICLDLLKTSWTGAYTISSTLSAIHQLLSYPDPSSPLNVDVAVLLREGDTVAAEGLVRWCCGEWRWDGR